MVLCDICGEPVLDGPHNKKRHTACKRELKRRRSLSHYYKCAADPDFRAANAERGRAYYARRHLLNMPKKQIGAEERSRRLARDRAARRRWMAELMADPVRYDEWRRQRSEYLARWRAAHTPEERVALREYLLEWKRQRALAETLTIAANLEGRIDDE